MIANIFYLSPCLYRTSPQIMIVVVLVVLVMFVTCIGIIGLLMYVNRTSGPSDGEEKRSAAQWPPMPSWAIGPEGWADTAVKQHEANRKRMLDFDSGGKRYDVVIYGDSITSGLQDTRSSLWDKYFPEEWKSGIFGVAGHRTEDLVWRVLSGGEKPALDPKCVVLLIGTNNVSRKSFDDTRIGYLLDWMKAAMPSSKILLMALLPRTSHDVAGPNSKLRALASTHGVTLCTCGQDLDPRNKALMSDGLHPTPEAYGRILKCLVGVVAQQL